MSGEDEARYLTVDGRRWRRQDPALPDHVARRLRSHRRRVGVAKHGLGERGTPW
ncbi:MAG: 2-polyprenylphenol hydroxylase, partial [Actinobacteria bacterium]|nr:2-polyprenylphenol hydroxylase [Actinomycetota bacterium]